MPTSGRDAGSSAEDVAGTVPLARPPRAHVGWQLRTQAVACASMGSPLYAHLLEDAAADVEAGGPVWALLAGHVAPGRGNALALRLMAAVHRLVLTGRAPELAPHYPSVGGPAGSEGAWPRFRRVVVDHIKALDELVRLPCQTNEVGRCAALAGGFFEMVARTGKPLRLLEVGASAGLNLRWDHYRYGGGGAAWGPPDSAVHLGAHWTVAPPHTDVGVDVVERAGCDAAPVDPLTDTGLLALRASVWADQTDRLAWLDGAVDVAQRVPATVDKASLDEWLPPRLVDPVLRTTTVVYHSVVSEYLDSDVRDRFSATVRDAGERATTQAPLAWLRLEPVSELRNHGVTLTLWPGGEERLLGQSNGHGRDVRWQRR